MSHAYTHTHPPKTLQWLSSPSVKTNITKGASLFLLVYASSLTAQGRALFLKEGFSGFPDQPDPFIMILRDCSSPLYTCHFYNYLYFCFSFVRLYPFCSVVALAASTMFDIGSSINTNEMHVGCHLTQVHLLKPKCSQSDSWIIVEGQSNKYLLNIYTMFSNILSNSEVLVITITSILCLMVSTFLGPL